MLYGLYSIKDELVSFGPLFVSDNDQTATRLLLNGFNAPNSMYSTRPQDYTLYRVGSYDTTSGNIEPCVPTFVTSCSDFRRKDKNED